MKVVTEKGTNTVRYIGDIAMVTETGIDCGSFIFGNPDGFNVYDTDASTDGVQVFKHTFTPDRGFQENPNWIDPATEKDARIAELEARLAQLEQTP